MITSMYINGNVAYFDKIMLRKKKIIVTKDRMMQMNVNQHSKPSNSKLAALTMTELVKVPESQNTETTLQTAQEAENDNMKIKKQLKKLAQKQRKNAKQGEAIKSSQQSFGTTEKSLSVEEILLECLNCFGVEKCVRTCKGCW